MKKFYTIEECAFCGKEEKLPIDGSCDGDWIIVDHENKEMWFCCEACKDEYFAWESMIKLMEKGQRIYENIIHNA